MTDRCEIFRNCRTTIPLSFLKLSTLCTIPYGFYASPNAQNRMCELCTFSQIRSQIYILQFGQLLESAYYPGSQLPELKIINSQPSATFQPFSGITLSKSNLLGQIYYTFSTGKLIIVYNCSYVLLVNGQQISNPHFKL